MARAWLRGPQGQLGSFNYTLQCSAQIMFLYFYLRYILGYTYLDEDVSGGSITLNGIEEDSGTDGVLTNTDFTFTSATASFSAGVDEGKFIVIKDSTNEVNSGIYEIVTVNSATQVVLNYYSTTFPVAATGLDWWLIDTADVATWNYSDFVVFRSPHATSPFELKLDVLSDSGASRTQMTVATESGSWNTSSHDWNSGAPVLDPRRPGCGYYSEPHAPRVYAYGDTDGSFLCGMNHTIGGTGAKIFWSITVLDPIFETSPAHAANEKVAIFGGNADNSSSVRNGSSTTGMDYGYNWSDTIYKGSKLARWCGWRDSGNDYFKRNFTLPNHRDGSEYDGLPIWVQTDADVSDNPSWSMIGAIPSSHAWLTACAGIGELTTFDTNQHMHWKEGFTTPWPGIDHV